MYGESHRHAQSYVGSIQNHRQVSDGLDSLGIPPRKSGTSQIDPER